MTHQNAYVSIASLGDVVSARFVRALGWSVAANVPTIALSFWL